MSEMLEKVARAILLARIEKTPATYGFTRSADFTVEAVARVVERDWHVFLPEARAAVEALREPSEGMVETADMDDRLVRSDYRRAFTAMIDHVLKES